MPAGAFKARCLAVMKEVQATGESIVVTRRGVPVAKVVPLDRGQDDIFGFMKEKVRIIGDIESPVPVECGWRLTAACNRRGP